LTKWQIVDARKATNKDKVTPFNDICLRSPYSNFFQVEDIGGEDLISANGPEITEASMFKIIKANIPHLPDWLFKRPHLNHNNITSSYAGFLDQGPLRRQEDRPKNLGSFPLDIQETFLIEDLLFAMTSIEGVYIKRRKVQVSVHSKEVCSEYSVEPYLAQPSCDFSLQFLVNKMLPLCNNHDEVQEFVNIHSQFEFGLVSHAMCGAIRVLLKEYLLLVT
jgi:gamma-tubulin complex component 2